MKYHKTKNKICIGLAIAGIVLLLSGYTLVGAEHILILFIMMIVAIICFASSIILFMVKIRSKDEYQILKDSYMKYNGSTFHMAREDRDAYNLYKVLTPGPQTLSEWDEELLDSLFSKLWENDDSFWWMHSRIIEVLNRKHVDIDRWVSRLLDEMEKTENLNNQSRIIVIESMSGRNSKEEDGGVHLICTETKYELRMVEVMNGLINFPCDIKLATRYVKAVDSYEEACVKYIKNVEAKRLINRKSYIKSDNTHFVSDDKKMKRGNYTLYNNHEYHVTASFDKEKKRNNVEIYTDNKDDIDESFQYDETLKRYYKIVEPNSLGDVFKYDIKYYYRGHEVEKCVGKQGEITLFTGDSKFAMANGFEEHDPRDRDYLKKNVPESEIEAKQIGPELNGRFKFM